MFGLFDRKKVITVQDAASSFIVNRVNACEAGYKEWRNIFIESIKSSGWESEELPEKIDENTLQWIFVASVMAYECLVIKNVFDARVAGHLYDAVYAELEKLASIAGIENIGDIVFGFLTQAEKDIKNVELMPNDSIAGSIIGFFGFRPREGEADIFPPISLMSISMPLMQIGGGFWKPLSENYNIKV